MNEKQKNCPYCHDRANLLQSNDERPVDDDMVYINKDGYLNLKTDWGHVYRMANYCPMCGRDLRSDEKFHQTYREEESDGEPFDTSFTGGD